MSSKRKYSFIVMTAAFVWAVSEVIIGHGPTQAIRGVKSVDRVKQGVPFIDVARKRAVPQDKAILIKDETDTHQEGIRSLLLGYASLGFTVSEHVPLEVGIRHVVEIHAPREVEDTLFPLGKLLFEGAFDTKRGIRDQVEAIFSKFVEVFFPQIPKDGGLQPFRKNMLGYGIAQAIDH